ncbi:MAG: hypothetical protein WC887_00285 [Candidatus Paceibacterota bacterium]|jgi:hypothetical protein
MTWPKASPVLIIAGIFDLLRIMFEQFWFFGPAIAATYCTAKVSGMVGTTIGSTICGAGASVIGTVGSPAIIAFGVVMAMAVGLFGWMTIGLVLIMTNSRIFKENEGQILWFVGSLLLSETPIIGTIPGLTGATIKMYHTQIKKDNENVAKYNKEQAAQQVQEQNQRNAELMQEQYSAQLEQAEQEEENENEETNEGEIPENVRSAA